MYPSLRLIKFTWTHNCRTSITGPNNQDFALLHIVNQSVMICKFLTDGNQSSKTTERVPSRDMCCYLYRHRVSQLALSAVSRSVGWRKDEDKRWTQAPCLTPHFSPHDPNNSRPSYLIDLVSIPIIESVYQHVKYSLFFKLTPKNIVMCQFQTIKLFYTHTMRLRLKTDSLNNVLI